MQRQERILAILGFLLIIAALSYVAVLHNRKIGNESAGELPNQQYVNTIYGFSFSYPPQYSLNEFTSRRVEVDDEGSGQGLVEVSVEIAENEPFKTFDDFARFRAMVTCTAGGPQGSSHCTSVSRSEPFTGKSGASGEVFYLTYELANGTATTTREAGPFYSFNISANVTEGSFAALLVYPAHAAEESGPYDAGASAALGIVNSLQLTKSGQ